MKPCPHCGFELQNDAHFCINCMQELDVKTNVKMKIGRRYYLVLPVFAILLCIALFVTAASFASRAETPVTTRGTETEAPSENPSVIPTEQPTEAPTDTPTKTPDAIPEFTVSNGISCNERVLPVVGDEINLTLKVGSTYGVPGEIAYVDLFLSAETFPADLTIRDWQFYVTGAEIGDDHTFYVEGGAFPFMNKYTNTIGCSAQYGCSFATADQLTTPGGIRIATLALKVPKYADKDLPVTIGVYKISAEDVNFNLQPTFCTVEEGVIHLQTESKSFPGAEGSGEVLCIPSLIDGEICDTVDQSSPITGRFTAVSVPACIKHVSSLSLRGELGRVFLMNAECPEDWFIPFAEVAECVYYVHTPNGSNSTEKYLKKYASVLPKTKPQVKNVLNVNGVHMNGDSLRIDACVEFFDPSFEKLWIEVCFTDGSKLEKEISTDGIEAGGRIIIETTVSDLPEDDEIVSVMLYGILPSENLSPIVVSCDPSDLAE